MKSSRHKLCSLVLPIVLLGGCADIEDGASGAGGQAALAGSGGAGGASSQATVGDTALEKPSSPEKGWQIEIPLFEVKPGEEIQDCYFVEAPYDVATFASKITVAMNQGSHHMNIFRVRTQLGLKGKPGDVVKGGECWKSPNWADWPLVMNMQLAGTNEWQLPEGVAHRFEPRELLMVQTHFVNASTQKTPIGGRVAINFERMPDDKVVHELGTVFTTNQSIQVCPGQKPRYEATCRFAREQDVTVVGANGHFHSRGRKFAISVWDGKSEASGQTFYESDAWDEPPFAKNLSVTVPRLGGVRYSCEYAAPADSCGDPEKQCCYTFGPHVETQEHCNAFLYYYPRRPDTDVVCF